LEVLLKDAEARRTYLQYVDMHARLLRRPEVNVAARLAGVDAMVSGTAADEGAGDRVPLEKTGVGDRTSRPRRRSLRWLSYVGVACATLAATILVQLLVGRGNERNAIPASASMPVIYVATLSQAQAPEWGPSTEAYRQGARVLAGDFQLQSGVARLSYDGGVELIVEGPAFLRLDDQSAATLFHGSTHLLIPLYALGVFTSFTLSQVGMVRRWITRRPAGWRPKALISGLGATTTGLVMVVTALAKFSDGAWIVVVVAVVLIAGFVSINRHYREVAGQLSLDGYAGPPPMQHTVLVLVGDLHKGVVQALQYARTLSPSAKAVYVEMDPEKTRRLEEKWGKWGFGVPLVVLTSPYRLLLSPLLEYVDHLLALGENHMVTIVIPEFIPAKWWQQLLHNQTALVIKGALLFRRNVIVTDVPYHLRR
jgi:hypothetical protein